MFFEYGVTFDELLEAAYMGAKAGFPGFINVELTAKQKREAQSMPSKYKRKKMRKTRPLQTSVVKKKMSVVSFKMPVEICDYINILQGVHNMSTKNRLMPHIIMMAMLDAAKLPVNKDWTKTQKNCHKKALKFRKSFFNSLFLVSCEKVIEEATAENPDGEMTVEKLIKRAEKNIREFTE